MPSWKKVIISGSNAALNSLTVTNGITGSLFGTASFATSASFAVSSSRAVTSSYAVSSSNALTASFVLSSSYAISSSNALTASYVNTLNQNVLVTGSATIGALSAGASENTLTLGARDAANEGGQIGFNAPGGTYTSASFIDNWQNKARILKGKEIREFNGKKYIMETALHADLAIIKGWKADKAGNIVYNKTARNFNPMMATAAKTTVAEVEEIVESGSLDPNNIHTPCIYVHHLVQGINYRKPIEKLTVREKI